MAAVLARDVDAAVPGREVVGPFCAGAGLAAALRSFARSRGESMCEAIVSRTFAEPTIMDFGRGLRSAALIRRLRTVSVFLVSSAFGGPTMETGLALFFGLPLEWLITVGLYSVGATAGDSGVIGLLPPDWKASGPSDRFIDSCILNMSSCIDERKRLGVPKLLALGRPGREGVEGEEEYGVVAGLEREETTGKTVVIGDGRN